MVQGDIDEFVPRTASFLLINIQSYQCVQETCLKQQAVREVTLMNGIITEKWWTSYWLKTPNSATFSLTTNFFPTEVHCYMHVNVTDMFFKGLLPDHRHNFYFDCFLLLTVSSRISGVNPCRHGGYSHINLTIR